jgi:chemotaxis protein histidine kinase CheA
MAKRVTHTLKGNAGAMQVGVIFDLAVQIENTLRQATKGTLTMTPDHVADLAQLLNQIELALG